MSLVPHFLEDLLPSSPDNMEEQNLFEATPPSSPCQRYMGDCDRSSAHYYRKKEYFRQIIIIRGSSRHEGGVHVITDEQFMQMKLRMAERERELQDEILRERQVAAEELHKVNELSQLANDELNRSKVDAPGRSNANEHNRTNDNELDHTATNELKRSKVDAISRSKVNKHNRTKVNELSLLEIDEHGRSEVEELKRSKVNDLSRSKFDDPGRLKVDELNQSVLNELERSNDQEFNRSRSSSWRKRVLKGLKKPFQDLSNARRGHQDKPEQLRNQLRKERQKSGAIKRKWEREFNRANKFEREKREEEKKVHKLSEMIVRMRQVLVPLEDENKRNKTDLEDALQRLDEKEEDIEFLEASLHEAEKRRVKLERELSRVLKDTADSEFADLNEIHYALLRKTKPCTKVSMAQKYVPVRDDRHNLITLGGGAFGRVFAYRQKRPKGKIVAMKILHATADDYDIRRQEIVLEARLLRLFTGTGVFPHVYNVGNLGIDTAIAMEFLGEESTFRSMTLNSWSQEKTVTVDHAKTVLLDVLSALHCLHSEDILHNDIKGDNVIVRQSDHDLFCGYLIDLGNASTMYLSAIYDFGQAERDLYEEDPLTIHYAPELIYDNAFTTTASDVYQVGQLIYIMGEDVHNEDLKEIGEKCTYREPLSRLRLPQVIELMHQL